MNPRRVWTAFLLAPLATPVVFVVVEALSGRLADWQGSWVYLMLFAGFTYPSVVAFGVPAYFLFRRLKLRSVTAYITAGVVIGLLSAIAWTLIFRMEVAPMFFASCLVAGILSVLIFRGIAHAAA